MKRKLFLSGVIAVALVLPLFSAVPLNPADEGAGYRSFDVFLLVLYVALALVFSFLCSIAEAVLLSITPSFIAGLRDTRPELSDRLTRLKHTNVDQSLAAILTLNTIAHTVGAIGSGAKATVVFGSAWFGLFSALMTLTILFLSEIIPKTLGAVYWRRLASPTATFVSGLIIFLYPLIWLSEKLTKLMAHGKDLHHFSREEFIALAGIGTQAGELEEHENRIVKNLFRSNTVTAEEIMTPRTVIVALQEDATVDEALDEKANTPFSRLPLYELNLDHVTGFVLKDDLLLAKAEGRGQTKLSELRRDIPSFIWATPLPELLGLLLEERQHIAVVVDEYGGTRGVVTLEDVVETLLGTEIVDEMDRVDDMQDLARQKWERRSQARSRPPGSTDSQDR